MKYLIVLSTSLVISCTISLPLLAATEVQLLAPLPEPYGQGIRTTPPINRYIQMIFPFMIFLTAIAAVGSLVVGGVLYMTGGVNPANVNRAKTYMWNAILGLLVVLVSVLILNTINPDITTLRIPIITIPGLQRPPPSVQLPPLPQGTIYPSGGEEEIRRGGSVQVQVPTEGGGKVLVGSTVARQCEAIKQGTNPFEGQELAQEKMERRRQDCITLGIIK